MPHKHCVISFYR